MTPLDGGPERSGDGGEERRYQQVLAVDPLGTGAVQRLLEALADPSWRVRHAAAERLGRADPGQAAPALVALLGGEEAPGRRNAAAAALIEVGAPAVPALTAALADPDPSLRTASAEILGELGQAAAVAALAAHLDDADPNTRAAAAEALGKLGGREAIDALGRALAVPDVPLRRAALDALARRRAPPPAARLAALYGDPSLRRPVLRLAGLSDEPVAQELLVVGLGDAARTVREAALGAIGERVLQRTEPRPALREAVRRGAPGAVSAAAAALPGGAGAPVRAGAIAVLAWSGDPRHAPALAAAGEDERLRPAAAEALAALGPGACAVLSAELPRLPVVGRVLALEALARAGAADARRELGALVAGEDDAVLAPALDALRRLEAAGASRGAGAGVVPGPAGSGAAGAGPAAATARMSAEEFRQVRSLIYRHCGLTFGDDLAYLLESRLGARLALRGLPDFTAYHRFLREHPDGPAELEAASEALTTHETYFYREPHQLRAFSEEILPLLARQNAHQRRLRIWSAGCSTGEEAYTIAVLLARSGLFDGWDVDVLGTDIARRVLAVAREGAYGARAFRTPEGEELRSWFLPRGERWHVRDDIRQLVRFGQGNLLDGRHPGVVGPVDVVFCRNVLIYLDLPARARVVRGFRSRLREGGYLLLGHSESLLNVTADFELVHLRHDLVYRKPLRPS